MKKKNEKSCQVKIKIKIEFEQQQMILITRLGCIKML